MRDTDYTYSFSYLLNAVLAKTEGGNSDEKDIYPHDIDHLLGY